MKIWILSDLHLEHHTFGVPRVECDVAILAGDIAVPGGKAVRWAKRASTFPQAKAVIFVPGNHEFYDGTMEPVLLDMVRQAEGSRVHVLNCTEFVFEGVRFLGCTLWTDFQLRLKTDPGPLWSTKRAVSEARRRLNDFRAIQLLDQSSVTRRRGFSVEDSLQLHWTHRRWLAERLNEPFSGPTVVITHHAPHRGSLAQRFEDDWLSPSFVSELESNFFKAPVLWVHGHNHDSFDYQVGNCRVVANPRGYMRRDGAPENGAFNPALVIEI